jgi:hypothetical protein
MRVKIVKNILDGNNKFLIWEINWKEKKTLTKEKKEWRLKWKKKNYKLGLKSKIKNNETFIKISRKNIKKHKNKDQI